MIQAEAIAVGVRYIYLQYPVQGGHGVAVYPGSIKSPMVPDVSLR